jgi:hypothetical protein
MVKLSPTRFYAEISLNFDITCKSDRPNFGIFSNFAIFSLKSGKTHRFFATIHRKNYLLLGKLIKFGQIFSKASSHKNKTLSQTLFEVWKPNSKYDFLEPTRKISKKKNVFFSFKVGSKDSHLNTDQKFGLRHDDILNF